MQVEEEFVLLVPVCHAIISYHASVEADVLLFGGPFMAIRIHEPPAS
jgi:hypothetical protein